MKIKATFAAALLAVVGFASFEASAQVYSVNAVGYVTLSVPPGFSMIANPLNSTNNTVSSLFSVPNGTTIYKYNTTSRQYDANNYFFGWTDGTMTLNPGEGCFFKNPASTNLNLTFVGDVLQGSLTNSLPAGYSIRASQVPQGGQLDTELGLPVENGDSVYFYDNASNSYVAYNYFFGWNTPPIAKVGQSFFLFKNNASNWVRSFSVN